MSLPAPRDPHQGGRWETIRYALDTNPRTFRLCLILSVAAVAPCLAALIAEVIRTMLLRALLPLRHDRAAVRLGAGIEHAADVTDLGEGDSSGERVRSCTASWPI